MSKPVDRMVQWPESRSGHAAASVCGPVMAVIGGGNFTTLTVPCHSQEKWSELHFQRHIGVSLCERKVQRSIMWSRMSSWQMSGLSAEHQNDRLVKDLEWSLLDREWPMLLTSSQSAGSQPPPQNHGRR